MSELFILVGPSYCGKSTYAEKLDNSYIVLSTDSMRGAISGDESDQTQNYRVFDFIKAMARYYLYLGKNVVIDATNLSRRDRRDFIDIGKAFKSRISAVVFNFDKKTLLERQKGRERVVPEEILDRQIAKYQPPSNEEFDEIIFV